LALPVIRRAASFWSLSDYERTSDGPGADGLGRE